MAHREPTFRLWVGAIITAIWAVSMVVDMLNPEYDPPAGLGPLMLAVATALFGKPVVEQLRKRVNGEDEG